METLVLIRGLPGCGKTTFAEVIGGASVAADDYFDKFHDGQFDASRLRNAHEWCQSTVDEWMSYRQPLIVVHNTFTTKKEMEAYYDMANRHGYRVIQTIVENTHGNVSVHDVPEETVEKMKDRFEVDL